ncbi:NF-kappa-B inhibitor-like protein 1 isoform X1 [Ptychodera flava]|uniref:NF-kappa-B inhibitor-like protein 1 isoform X1 n=1 Tax=Ptychodera flava TaxID=63121 RepID=UPI00396A483E
MYTDRNMKRREEKLVRYMNEGNLPKLKSLLKKHRNIDVNIIKNSQGRTPLHTACLSSDDAIVRCLLKHGADATVQDFHGDTALHLSLSNALSGNKFAYFDIAVLLMRSFPECLKIKNKKGVSSKRLLKKVKEKLRNWEEEEKERARQNEKESEEREAEMRWNERLAEEWADDVGSSWYHHEWDTCNESASQYETYDEWAERVSGEYHRKHHKRKHGGDDDDKVKAKRHREQQQRAFQRQLEKEHEEYKQRSSRRIQEQRAQKKKNYLRKCETFFSGNDAELYQYRDVPWPGGRDDVQEMINILLSDVDKSDEKLYKKFIRSQQILWHPDKFIQRVGGNLRETDREKILDKVTELSQALNNLNEKS